MAAAFFPAAAVMLGHVQEKCVHDRAASVTLLQRRHCRAGTFIREPALDNGCRTFAVAARIADVGPRVLLGNLLYGRGCGCLTF